MSNGDAHRAPDAWYARPMRRALPVLIALTLLPQCNRTAADVVASHKEASTERVARLQAVGTMVADTPPLTEDGIRLDGPLPDFSDDWDEREGRAAVIMDTDLASPTTYKASLLQPKFPSPVAVAASIAMTGAMPDGTEPDSPRAAEGWLEILDELRYVLVVRMLDYRAPVAQVAWYDHGWIRADALLFDLDTVKLLGGFRFQVTTAESVNTSLPLQKSLDNSMRWNLSRAIRTGLARHLPATNLPRER